MEILRGLAVYLILVLVGVVIGCVREVAVIVMEMRKRKEERWRTTSLK